MKPNRTELSFLMTYLRYESLTPPKLDIYYSHLTSSALFLKNVKIYLVYYYYTLSTSLLSMQRKRMRCDKVGTISLNTKLNQDQNFNVFKNIKNLFLLDF